MRDATRRAAEVSLQGLETRMRLCALIECEPLHSDRRTDTNAHTGILRLSHIYFDDPGKYRLVLYSYPSETGETSQRVGDLIWCSEVVYDTARPEGKGGVLISGVVRKAYRAAEERGYRLLGIEQKSGANGE